LLSEEEYREFQGLLREYKAKELPIQALMTKMCSLFATEERTDLLHRFVQFIPARYRNDYRAMVAEYETSASASAPSSSN
jgi:histone deacetylase complex regulatory component SIN3